ncbi:glycoside hydrolase family 1 protein [Candidatus Parcubacteria bacterium]|nr:MAG: glycoside hydrolase family 1 protein [Candidatus Parcubacteria bacterium]
MIAKRDEEGESLQFPKGFLWGAATSSHQVEGDNFHNDWWQAEQEGKVPFKSGKACNHYELFEEDFALAEKMNHNAHRFSIEWSRIEPEEGTWNMREVHHYRRVLQRLKDKGFKTFVTLHHFTNPLWFVSRGGWENKQAIFYFSRFARFIYEQLGELIDFCITINEPLPYIAMGYREGLWPPFRRSDYISAFKVFNNMVLAHNQASKSIKLFNPKAKIGIAANLIDFQPRHRWNPIDRLISFLTDYFWNRLFLDRITKNTDFIGVNYYFHHHVHTAPFIFGKSHSGHEFSDMGWGIHPEGLYFVLKKACHYGKPLFVTENGIADAKDEKRVNFILGHLRYVYQAIQEGVDVRGYFYWSLMDNFEWADGFWPRFGLLEVDYKTMKRIFRPSSKVFSEICKRNGIPPTLMKI